MGDARIIPVRPTPGEIAPADAAASLLRHAWRKTREHLKHALPWMVLCGVLSYDLWVAKSRESQVVAQATGENGAASPSEKQPAAVPTTLVGRWSLIGPYYTELEFAGDGTVISRMQRKVEKGTYTVKDSQVELRFAKEPLFWEGRLMPTRYAFSGNELTLFATRVGGDFANASVYRFKRLDAATAPELAARTATQEN